MLVLRKIYSGYNKVFNENLDPRLENLPLAGSPLPVIIILTLYLLFVNGRGQKWMEKRKAFELNTLMKCYNIFQVVSNGSVFLFAFALCVFENDYRFFCIIEPKHFKTDLADGIVKISYFLLLLKFIDLLDTVFFILRKKNNQVTFLHTYHHAGVFALCYVYIKLYSGGGVASLFGLINSFVHMIMYSYYFLTSYNPEVKKSLWWKKYITQLQLVQFILLMIYALVNLFIIECSNSKVMTWLSLLQSVILFTMFGDFYYKAYIKKKNT